MTVQEASHRLVRPIVSPQTWQWCRRSYPLHPQGCPNYNKKEGCPPNSPMLGQVISQWDEVYAIFNVFDFGAHVQRMKEKHPNWSDRQSHCCLYWQPKARKQLRAKIAKFKEQYSGFHIIQNPEAHGVNLTATMREVGIELEWPPITVAYQIVLAGRKR